VGLPAIFVGVLVIMAEVRVSEMGDYRKAL
jgi:hypothetical protein